MISMAIRAYQHIPWRARCPREGASCSELALAAAADGVTMREIAAIVASCRSGGVAGRGSVLRLALSVLRGGMGLWNDDCWS